MRKRPPRRFAFDSKYDFGYRPATYWEELPGDLTLLTKIRGSARRRIAGRALEGEQLERLGGDELYREAMEFVLAEELTDDDRDSWGRIDPKMLGGEFLPSLQAGETEIVRIELQSTTFDVIELRASLRNGRIYYRVVDEYEDEGSYFIITPRTSSLPLTFGALIALLDSTLPDKAHRYTEESLNLGLFERFLNLNIDSVGAWELVDFVSVNSPFYPQLSEYYEDRALAWYLEAEGEEWIEHLETELEELQAEVQSGSIELQPLDQYEPGEAADLAAAALLAEGRLEEAEALADLLGTDGTWIQAHLALAQGNRAIAARLAHESHRF